MKEKIICLRNKRRFFFFLPCLYCFQTHTHLKTFSLVITKKCFACANVYLSLFFKGLYFPFEKKVTYRIFVNNRHLASTMRSGNAAGLPQNAQTTAIQPTRIHTKIRRGVRGPGVYMYCRLLYTRSIIDIKHQQLYRPFNSSLPCTDSIVPSNKPLFWPIYGLHRVLEYSIGIGLVSYTAVYLCHMLERVFQLTADLLPRCR